MSMGNCDFFMVNNLIPLGSKICITKSASIKDIYFKKSFATAVWKLDTHQYIRLEFVFEQIQISSADYCDTLPYKKLHLF